ncbi:MAG: hypothetical protein R6V16_07035 [Bacteroidales bacterium]
MHIKSFKRAGPIQVVLNVRFTFLLNQRTGMSVVPKKPCKGERLVTPGATRGTRDVSNPQQAGLPAVWQVVVSTCNKPVCCGKNESEKDLH